MILVTGGAGRIGKHLVKALLASGEKVRVLVKRSDVKSPEDVNGAEIAEGDLLDISSLENALKGVDTIYHLAAVVDYFAPKKRMWDVNVEGTKNLVEVCRKAGTEKIIYLSSTAVYGKKLAQIPADEQTLCKPSNFYGKTKLAAEKIVLANNGIVLRSADAYGSGFEEGYYLVFSMLERGMCIIGSGKNRIQYIEIRDLIDALLLARNAKQGVYLIAGSDVKTQEELFALCCKFLGCGSPQKRIALWQMRLLVWLSLLASKLKRRRPKLLQEYIDKLAADRVFSTDKAKKELGWKPSISYEQGLKEMIEEYKSKK